MLPYTWNSDSYSVSSHSPQIDGMAKERADLSHDLLPYHKMFRHFRDVKYSFSSERISYRKRRRARSVSGPASGAKVCHIRTAV